MGDFLNHLNLGWIYAAVVAAFGFGCAIGRLLTRGRRA